jgi:hypothetical protein
MFPESHRMFPESHQSDPEEVPGGASGGPAAAPSVCVAGAGSGHGGGCVAPVAVRRAPSVRDQAETRRGPGTCLLSMRNPHTYT